MKKIIIFLITLILIGCISSKRVIVGRYEFKGINGISYEMELQSNGKFIFFWQNGLNKGTTSGTWEKEDGFLVLNGGTKPPDQKIIVKESSHLIKDSLYFEVKDFDENSLGLALIVLNDKKVIFTDGEGKAVIGKTTIKQIKIYYLNSDIPTYLIRDQSSNYFVIKAYIELNTSVYFENTKVQIKGENLILPANQLSEYPITLKLFK